MKDIKMFDKEFFEKNLIPSESDIGDEEVYFHTMKDYFDCMYDENEGNKNWMFRQIESDYGCEMTPFPLSLFTFDAQLNILDAYMSLYRN